MSLHIAQLRTESHHEVIDSRYNRLALLVDARINFCNNGAIRRRVLHQTITLQNCSIVIIHHGFERTGTNTRVCGKQFELLAVTRNLPHHFSHIELIAQIKYAIAVRFGLLNINLRCIGCIRNQVATLIRRDAAINIAQFGLNHTKSLVDKLRSIGCHLIFIFKPGIVVSVHQRTKHIFCTLNGVIRNCQLQHRRLLILLGNLNTCVGIQRIIDRRTEDLNRQIIACPKMRSRRYQHAANRGIHNLVETTFDDTFFL